MMIPEFGRNFTLTWIVERRGMRSQTNCRNIAKVEPTTDRGSASRVFLNQQRANCLWSRNCRLTLRETVIVLRRAD
jgi:hypothetical protein